LLQVARNKGFAFLHTSAPISCYYSATGVLAFSLLQPSIAMKTIIRVNIFLVLFGFIDFDNTKMKGKSAA
jgi:hypothetical protein